MIATRYDRSMMLRGCALTCAVAVVALVLSAATDEGGLDWATRLSRTAPALPVASALGAWLALAPERTRRELVALEALGRSRAWARGAAALGAAIPSLAISALLAAGAVLDTDVLFPRVVARQDFAWANGAFESALLGVRVAPDGAISRVTERAAAEALAVVPAARHAAAGALALMALALPLLATAPSRPLRRASHFAWLLSGSIGAFQLVAARWWPPVSVVAVPALAFVLALADLTRAHERGPARELARWTW